MEQKSRDGKWYSIYLVFFGVELLTLKCIIQSPESQKSSPNEPDNKPDKAAAKNDDEDDDDNAGGGGNDSDDDFQGYLDSLDSILNEYRQSDDNF